MPHTLRALKKRIAATAIVLALGLDAALAVLAFRDRNALLTDAAHSTRTLATTVEQHASDTFASMGQVLSGIGEVMAARPQAVGADAPPIKALLERRLQYARNATSLFFVDASGRWLTDTGVDGTQPADVRDRRYFRSHADGPGRGLVIEGPFQSRVTGRWILVASMRLEDGAGRFVGVVAAAIEPEHLRAYYERAGVGAGSSVLLLAGDGTIVARHPDQARFIGASLAGSKAFEQMQEADAGSGEAISPLDDTNRIFSYQRSARYGVIAVVSLSKDAVLARWRTSAWTYAIIALLANAAILAAGRVIYRQLLGRAQTLRDLEGTAAQLTAALEDANQANAAKLHFLANMSHELRTPLNAIIGFSDVMRHGVMGPIGNPRYASYIDDIHRSAGHLLALINDLLDISRAEAGRYVLHLEPCPIAEVADECLIQVRARAAEAGIQIANRLGPDLPLLQADRKALRQMLLNLLANAIKFTARGGRVTLTATLLPSGGIALTVSDTGLGIAPEDVERVFEPFQQVNSRHTRRHDGVGLGLPLVKSLARQHEAEVLLRSVLGEGTSVTISFPPTATLAAAAVQAGGEDTRAKDDAVIG